MRGCSHRNLIAKIPPLINGLFTRGSKIYPLNIVIVNIFIVISRLENSNH